MSANAIEKTKVWWTSDDNGHVCSARAINGKGRILSSVNVTVDVDKMYDLKTTMGDQAVSEVEKAAEDLARHVAELRYPQG